MFRKSLLSSLTLFALMFHGCSSNDDANDLLASNEYVLTSLANQQYIIKNTEGGFTLEGAEDKVILLDLFATWCPPCKASAAHLTSLQEKYKDDLVIIGVTIEDGINNEELLKFRTDYKADYVLVNSTENRRIIDAVALKLEVGERFPIPLMALYKDGKLINHYMGATQEEFIESDIKVALGKQ